MSVESGSSIGTISGPAVGGGVTGAEMGSVGVTNAPSFGTSEFGITHTIGASIDNPGGSFATDAPAISDMMPINFGADGSPFSSDTAKPGDQFADTVSIYQRPPSSSIISELGATSDVDSEKILSSDLSFGAGFSESKSLTTSIENSRTVEEVLLINEIARAVSQIERTGTLVPEISAPNLETNEVTPKLYEGVAEAYIEVVDAPMSVPEPKSDPLKMIESVKDLEQSQKVADAWIGIGLTEEEAVATTAHELHPVAQARGYSELLKNPVIHPLSVAETEVQAQPAVASKTLEETKVDPAIAVQPETKTEQHVAVKTANTVDAKEPEESKHPVVEKDNPKPVVDETANNIRIEVAAKTGEALFDEGNKVSSWKEVADALPDQEEEPEMKSRLLEQIDEEDEEDGSVIDIEKKLKNKYGAPKTAKEIKDEMAHLTTDIPAVEISKEGNQVSKDDVRVVLQEVAEKNAVIFSARTTPEKAA